MNIAEYEAMKCKTLRKYGCPENELWLTECQSIEAAKMFYEPGTIEDLCNGQDYEGCVYYHESGDLHVFSPFNNMEEFEKGCKYIADYLKGSEVKE